MQKYVFSKNRPERCARVGSNPNSLFWVHGLALAIGVESATIRRGETDRDKQTDRQTERQTDRQKGRQTDRQATRQTDRQTDRQINRGKA